MYTINGIFFFFTYFHETRSKVFLDTHRRVVLCQAFKSKQAHITKE